MKRVVEFSWEAGSKSNCPLARTSRVLFLLARPRKVRRPREEVIIRYELSLGEQVETKYEGPREARGARLEKEQAEKKRNERQIK